MEWKTGRDLLKVIGNTGRRLFGDDVWVRRLLEEIDHHPNPPGIVIIDDMRFPTEYDTLCRKRQTFTVRLVTSQPVPLTGVPVEMVDGLLKDRAFDATVPAKGLVTQEMLEKIVADLWVDRIAPWVGL